MSRFKGWGERGQGLVEFALVFPILVLLLFGIVDFGRAIYAYNTVASAARDGVRVAVVNQNTTATGCTPGSATTGPDTTKISPHDCAVASAIMLGGVTATVIYRDITDTTTCGGNGLPQVGCLAEVTVNSTFQPITPVIGNIVGSVTLSATSKQPVEFVCPIAAAVCVPGT
jgi:Flp pilus assembly protein TadG